MPTCQRSSVRGSPADDDVAAGVDGEVPGARVLQDGRRAVDGPALDEAGGIEATAGLGVEVPTRVLAELLAALEHVSDLRVGVVPGELAAPDAADLALRLVRRERVVDEAQPVEDVVDGCSLHVAVANVDDDPHPHHVLDGGHTRRPFSNAICSDFSNADARVGRLRDVVDRRLELLSKHLLRQQWQHLAVEVQGVRSALVGPDGQPHCGDLPRDGLLLADRSSSACAP